MTNRMTKEETIKILKDSKAKISPHDLSFHFVEHEKNEALDMAIKALEQEPCEDAISRQAIIDMTGLSEWFDSSDSYNDFIFALSELPPATPQPKTGHWIAQDIHNCHTNFKCSECDYIHSFMHLYGKPTADYTYCPICGAKMVEPQESEEKE